MPTKDREVWLTIMQRVEGLLFAAAVLVLFALGKTPPMELLIFVATSLGIGGAVTAKLTSARTALKMAEKSGG